MNTKATVVLRAVLGTAALTAIVPFAHADSRPAVAPASRQERAREHGAMALQSGRGEVRLRGRLEQSARPGSERPLGAFRAAPPLPPPRIGLGDGVRGVHRPTEFRTLAAQPGPVAPEGQLGELAAGVGQDAGDAAETARLAHQAADLERRLAAAPPGPNPERRRLEEALARVRAALQARGNPVLALGNALLWVGASPVAEKRIPLVELNGVVPREAFRLVLTAAGVEHVLAEDLPSEPPVTLKAANVRLGAVLSVLCDTVDVGASVEHHQGKPRVRVGKGEPRPGIALGHGTLAAPGALNPGRVLSLPWPEEFSLAPNLPGQLLERRSTFQCPHCRGQVTTVRRPASVRCSRCSRPLAGEWAFCPADGTPRPEVPGEWKFCPLCGKAVRMQQGVPAAPTAPPIAPGAPGSPGVPGAAPRPRRPGPPVRPPLSSGELLPPAPAAP